MAGTKIDGNAIAKGIREKLNAQIKETQKVNPRYRPSLHIIQGTYLKLQCSLSNCALTRNFPVGDRSDSSRFQFLIVPSCDSVLTQPPQALMCA